MPTYEYECKKCGHHFEKSQNMVDKPISICPKCKKKSLRRLIGAGSGIIFKGSGFYATDYKKAADKTSDKKPCPQAREGKDSPCSACSLKQGESK